jgi:hypothetical protein
MTEMDYMTMKFQELKFANKNLEIAENLRTLALVSLQLIMIDLRLMTQPG